MRYMRWLVLTSVLLAWLGGCALPRPGVDGELPPASENSAVLALLDQARAEAGGARAAAALERALRIEPRNPRLWLELARHHLALGDTAQAEQLAQRANALAGTDRRLRAVNWQVIASARRAGGNEAGAEAAEARVREFSR